MDDLREILSWGSPVGIALFFLITAIAGAIFFWGLSLLNKSKKNDRNG